MKYIGENEIKNKRVLLRLDCDVPFDNKRTILNDLRIQKNVPTMRYLLENNNKLICVAKLGRPHGREAKFSLDIVAEKLQVYFPTHTIYLLNDFLTTNPHVFNNQKETDIFLLENIRFYPEEQKDDEAFARRLASLADVYVNDAFAMCHRRDASIIGVPRHLPSFAGFLVKEEVSMLIKALTNPKKPLVAIIGGAKTTTKLPLLMKLIELADILLMGGALANTFLKAQGLSVGTSMVDNNQEKAISDIMTHAKKHNTTILLPIDAICADKETAHSTMLFPITAIPSTQSIFDIGPQTQRIFNESIASAQTIIWNGPVGFSENPLFAMGTKSVCQAITTNTRAFSLVGGGNTTEAIAQEKNIDTISYISTGGGSMLEFIEKGTLPGIQALE